MEFEDLSIVSMYHAFDTDYNIKNMQQPSLSRPSALKVLLYGMGRAEPLNELNKYAHAKLVKRLHYNEVIFTPNIKPEYSARPDVRRFARDTVRYCLRDLGFIPDNTCDVACGVVPICVHVPLNVPANVRRMGVFGPYMMFDKRYMLTTHALSKTTFKTR